MKEFMMLMKGSGEVGDWDAYIKGLVASGKFRGGSALGHGTCARKDGQADDCAVTGFMRFEAESIDDVRELLNGNPVYEAGFEIEIHELVKS